MGCLQLLSKNSKITKTDKVFTISKPLIYIPLSINIYLANYHQNF